MSPSLDSFRWIVFDAVGTLVYPWPSVAEAYQGVAARYGSQLTVEEIGRRFAAAFRQSEQEDDGFVTSEAIERKRWRFLVGSVLEDVSDPAACFEDLFSHFGRPQAWRCFSDVEETGRLLSRAGHRLAIASNFDGRLHGLCDGLPELAPFSRRITSAELGVRKPSPRFYTALARTLDSRPDDVLMIGDDEDNDVRAARQAGLSAILLSRKEPHPEAIRDLRELVPG